jgi:uncharacterized protein (TIGR03086 family)
MDVIELLDRGYAWSAERIAAVRTDHLDGVTPCAGWDVRQLLNHMVGSLGLLTGAAAGEVAEPSRFDAQALADTDLVGADPAAAFAQVRSRAAVVWREPGVMARTCAIPFGATPAPMLASLTLLEVVVHGWDVSQATGEAAEIAPELVGPIFSFARVGVDGRRGTAFAADLGIGDNPSDRLVAFLGRKP